MHSPTRLTATLLPSALLSLVVLLPSARGQDPFAPEAAAADEAPPPIPDIGSIQNPAVRAAYELPRREPADYLRAVLNLLDLGEPQLAAVVFRELEGLNLNDEQRAALVSRVGTAALLRLGQADEALGPNASGSRRKPNSVVHHKIHSSAQPLK